VPRNTFQEGLLKAMERGNLRVADVARWFGRRHSTARGWVVDGREPAGTPADLRALFARLNELNAEIARSRSLTSYQLRERIAQL